MTAVTLTPQEYDAIRRFAEGETPPAIAEAIGMRWMEVRDLLNARVNGHQGKAKRLIENLPRPDGVSPLTAPIVKPKPVKPLPARLVEEPVPAGLTVEEKVAVIADQARNPATPYNPIALAAVAVAEEAVSRVLPKPPMDDLDTMDGVLAVAREHAQHTVRTSAARATALVAELRNQIIEERREALVRERIASLEAELGALRGLLAA